MAARTRLAAWVVRAALRLAMCIADKPPLPPVKYWRVGEPGERMVYVVFVPDRDPLMEFHVVAVVFDDEFCYAVEAARMEPLIRRVEKGARAQVPDIAFDARAAYVVAMPFDARKRNLRDGMLGVCDCVAVAKRAAGIYAPDVFTPRQLLAELWRRHEQRN